jgi:hypothetical protein
VQLAWPVAVLYVPAGHGRHDIWLLVGWYQPGLHNAQVLGPVSYVPGKHVAAQCPEPSALFVPAAHGVQGMFPLELYVPGEHS